MAATTRREVDQWAKEAETALRRRIGSQAFQQAVPDVDGLEPVRFPGKAGDGSAVRRTGPAVARGAGGREKLGWLKRSEISSERSAKSTAECPVIVHALARTSGRMPRAPRKRPA